MRLLVLLLCLLPAMAEARVIAQAAAMEIRAGGFCTVEADGTIPAPKARDGHVLLHEEPYAIVLPGDEVPGLTDLGIGLVLRLQDFRPGEQLELQIQALGFDPAPDVWTMQVSDDGSFWFGRVPDPSDHLVTGTYRYSVSQRGRQILVYEMQVRPPTPEDRATSPCRPAVS